MQVKKQQVEPDMKQQTGSKLGKQYVKAVYFTLLMAAHQAPQFLGFSRQEHWSGLPFPSSMHESEK